MKRGFLVIAIAVLVVIAVAVAGCGRGSSRSADSIPQRDPVTLATYYGEAAVTCDMAHQMIAAGWQGGWTAYVPESPRATLLREQRHRARVALEGCRRDVERGSRVSATLVSRNGAQAVVAVRTVAPSGRSRTVRMYLSDLRQPGESSGRWIRIR